MKAGFQIEIALNSDHSDCKNNTEQTLLWLQKMIPLIMQPENMKTDEFFLVPLNQVTLCLN